MSSTTTYGMTWGDLLAEWRRENDAGEGWGIGLRDESPREAAEGAGATVLDEHETGDVLVLQGARLYVIRDVHGPWACAITGLAACSRLGCDWLGRREAAVLMLWVPPHMRDLATPDRSWVGITDELPLCESCARAIERSRDGEWTRRIPREGA